MAIFKLNQETKKETIEDRLNRAINLGRREALKEVLEWLKEKTYTIYYRGGSEAFNINFESEEELLQSFKERFNIEYLVYIQVRALYCPPVSITKAFQRSETIQSRRSLMGGQFNRTKNWKLTFKLYEYKSFCFMDAIF